ncbi:hypothetical protein V8E53_005897 [Lactarius tabidus]
MGACCSNIATDTSPPLPTRRVSQHPQSNGDADELRPHNLLPVPPPQGPHATFLPPNPVRLARSIPAPMPTPSYPTLLPISNFTPVSRLSRATSALPPPTSARIGGWQVSEGGSLPQKPRSNFTPTSHNMSRTTSASPYDIARIPVSEGGTSRKLPRPTKSIKSNLAPISHSVSARIGGWPDSEGEKSQKPPLKSGRSNFNFTPTSYSISRTISAPARIGDWPVSEGEMSWKPLPESGRFSRPMSRSVSLDTFHNSTRYRTPLALPSPSVGGGHSGTVLDSQAGPRAAPKRAATSGNHRPFLPTVREVLPDGFRFRILVLGKRQSGKSSLINSVFNVDLAASPSQHGNADINASIAPDGNRYLVVHEYSGFESGDAQSLQTIQQFISTHTDASRPVSRRLHAIWICVPMSDAVERGLGEGVKTILGTGKVPVMIVFTKFDLLVSRVQFDNARGDIQWNDDPVAKAHAMYGDLCRSLFDREPKDWPAVIFSEKRGYCGLIDGLTSTTHEFIKAALHNSTDHSTSFQGPLPVPPIPALLGWSIAQRVNHHITIQASIEVGRYRYWRSLGSSQDFTGQTLESCVNVIREDIINVWNFDDSEGYLFSRDFAARMSRLVGDLAGSPDVSPELYLSGTVMPMAQWTNGSYQNNHKNIRCLMAYIVDLTVILYGLFGSSHSVSATTVQSVVKDYVRSGSRKQIHEDIRSFVTLTPLTYQDKDIMMTKIVDLINQNCVPTSNVRD